MAIGDSPLDTESISELGDLFGKAEEVVKRIEYLDGEITVPAINQLRYAGNHLIRYLNNPANKEELDDASKHCRRAAYDAYEAAILYHLLEYDKFRKDYSRVVVTTVIPDYIDIVDTITSARDFISRIKGKSRQNHYEECEIYLGQITKNTKKLDDAREELNKLIKRERDSFIVKCGGIVAATAAVITLVVTLLQYWLGGHP